ncbi:unnamed protein product [Phytomonas sp. EM1]|nr:unnamed protein product [Phytomonas sp. EM1]|eukprot:CCW61216.1 unnamed protein product [Phytomonas sp. isolate EM1]
MTTHYVIGFTGTIASGKTVRCHRLLQAAINHQLSALHSASKTGKKSKVSVEEALQLASTTALAGQKSTAFSASYLPLLQDSPLSVKYINADLLGHSVYLPGTPCYYQLIQRFGERILMREEAQGGAATASLGDSDSLRRSGNTVPSRADVIFSASPPPINRHVLGKIVFADLQELSALNAICWPHIMEAFKAQYSSCVLAAQESGKRVTLFILEAALLLEIAGMLRYCTDVWITSCSEEEAASRLALRNGLGAAEVAQRITAQASLFEKIKTLRRIEFANGLKHFNTSETTLDEGLRQVDLVFEKYWRDKIKPWL